MGNAGQVAVPQEGKPLPEAYLVFEGGGAKGFVHIGALRALESEVKIIGTAGTSAGAIIASLVAAGFTADDLIDSVGQNTLLSKLGVRRLTDLFGDKGWERIGRLRHALARPGDFWHLGLSMIWPIACATLAGAVLGGFAGLGVAHSLESTSMLYGGGGLGLGLMVGFVRGAYVSVADVSRELVEGMASTKEVSALLDRAYRLSLSRAGRSVPVGRKVWFRDLQMPLTVVATAPNGRKMKVFSKHDTPTTSVADAVAASICLPIVFGPAQVDGVDYYDGGLVSNLPVWAFDEERRANPAAYTIALEIAEVEASAPYKGNRRWRHLGLLLNAARASLFGGKALNFRAVDRLCICSLPATIGILDFDRSLQQVQGMINRGVVAAKSTIIHNLFTVPGLYEEYCFGLRNTLMQAIEQLDGPDKPTRIRVAIAMPEGDQHLTMRLAYGAGFNGDPDLGLVLPVQGTLVGKAFREKRPVFGKVPFERGCDLAAPQHGATRGRIWPGMKWCFVIPISTNDDDLADIVLSVDGDGAYEYFFSLLDAPFWVDHIEQLKSVQRKAYQPFNGDHADRLVEGDPDGVPR